MAEEEKQEIEEKQEVQEEQTTAEKKYTDDEVNAMIMKKNEKALSKEYKELGFDSREDLMKYISEKREKDLAEMTEVERLKAEKEEREKADSEKDQKLRDSEAKLAAYKLNVDEAYINDVIRLLPDGEGSVEERMKEFLSKRPVYLKKAGKDFGGDHKDQQGDEKEILKKRIRESMGLKA